MFTDEYVFGKRLTEPTASNLPCSLIYEHTTKQGQIGPKPEKASGSYLNAREVVYIYYVYIYMYMYIYMSISRHILILRRH